MAQTTHSVTAVLPARHLPKHRTFWCSRYVCNSANTAAAFSTSHAYRTHRGTGSPIDVATPAFATLALSAPETGTVCHAGKAWNQKPNVCCNSAQGQPVQQRGPDISRLNPALQQQWDHAANAHLGNIDIKPCSGRKVWWTCDQCPDGHLHSWEAFVHHRTKGSGCPQCSGRKVCKHNSLATKAPKVAAQWDYEANKGTPNDVVAQCHLMVGWRCDVCGHPWRARIDSRVSIMKRGCPQCAYLSRTKNRIKHPTFAEAQDPHSKAVLAQWDHERNPLQSNFPHNTTLQSRKQIFWLCHKCPAGQEHSWCARPNHRAGRNKTGCPFCAGRAACKCNSLPSRHPDIAAEWDLTMNEGQPSDYTASSIHPAWWFTPQHGSWQQTICSRTHKSLVRNRSGHE